MENNLEIVRTLIWDLRTHTMVYANKNYGEKLKEAYAKLKASGITTEEEFTNSSGLEIGAFTYYELTYLERIKNPEYLFLLNDGINSIRVGAQIAKENPNLGDELTNFSSPLK